MGLENVPTCPAAHDLFSKLLTLTIHHSYFFPQVIVSIRTWEAATFVEVVDVADTSPMYQIANNCCTSNRSVKVWQLESPLGEAGGIVVKAGDMVPFSFDDPDVGAKLTFVVDDCEAKTINAKHPSQNDFVDRDKRIRFMTSISGYSRKLTLYDGKAEASKATLSDVDVLTAEIQIPSVGLSVVALNRTELLYASIRGIRVTARESLRNITTQFSVADAQIDNQTSCGHQVAFQAGNSSKMFVDCTLRRNKEVTAMPYYEQVEVSVAPFHLMMYELWLNRLRDFEHDAMGTQADGHDAQLKVSNTVKYRRRALIGVTRYTIAHPQFTDPILLFGDNKTRKSMYMLSTQTCVHVSSQKLETLSFLGKGVNTHTHTHNNALK